MGVGTIAAHARRIARTRTPGTLTVSERIRLNDVRRLFRLIGEVRELGADPARWRPHLLERLARIARADLIVSSEVHFRTTSAPGVLAVTDIGWVLEAGGEPWQVRTERVERPENYWLAITASTAANTAAAATNANTAAAAASTATATIPAAASTATIASSSPRSASSAGPAVVDDAPAKLRPGDRVVPVTPAVPLRGGKGFILSQYPLAHLGAVDQLGLHRFGTARPFTPADHKLVRLFHVELGRLWRGDALRRAADPAHTLPPRLSETLRGILAGDSEKQIAFALGLSQHTVHNYIRALHRRYDVSSRAELIAKASAEQQFDFRPKLSLAPPPATRTGAAERDGTIPTPEPGTA